MQAYTLIMTFTIQFSKNADDGKRIGRSVKVEVKTKHPSG